MDPDKCIVQESDLFTHNVLECDQSKAISYAVVSKAIVSRKWGEKEFAAYDDIITEPLDTCDMIALFIYSMNKSPDETVGSYSDCLAYELHKRIPEFMDFRSAGYPGRYDESCGLEKILEERN